jgi:ABC-type transport system involved in multi-copper enzyme maturation permease subunit
MFWHFLRFELRYWLRSMMVWVFFFIIGAMFFGAASSDQIIVGSALQNTYRNAPFVVEQFYAMACILTLLMATAFANSAAARDFQYNTSQIIFSTPLRKLPYLLGHFAGAALISVIPMLGVSAAVLLARYMPWVDAERWGPIHWHAHLNGILVFAIPNTIFVSAIIFAIAALTRSTITSFLGALLLLVAYGIAGAYMSDLNNETVSMLLDPFGIRTFALLTKYWTVADKNNLSLPLTGIMLLNRLIWVAVGLLVLAFACARFRFEERAKKPKQTVESETSLPRAVFEPRSFTPAFGPAAQGSQLLSQIRVEFLSLVKTTTFIVILVAALLNCIPSLILSAKAMYGVSSLPVTYNLLDIIRGTLYLFLIAIVTYFAGVLVWKERDARCDEIHDALPYPNWIPYVAKFLALLAAIALILLLAMLAAMGVQTWHHYTRYQLGLYLRELFVLDFLGFVFYTFLAFLIHILSPNKYAGYFAYVAFLIANVFVWRPLNVATIMVRFGDMPSYVYSDLYLFAPFIAALTWFAVYWLLFCGLLAIASVLLWPRGKETSFRDRLRNARQNFQSVLRPLTAALLTGWIACAGWVFYNTKVLHHLIAEKERDRLSAGYEKTYKKYQSLNQPRIQSVHYDIDIYPAERNLILRGDQVIKNTGDQPISEIHLNYQRNFDTTIGIEHTALKQDDKRLLYRIYSVNPPLAPGESLRMKFTVAAISRGFEQSLSHNNLVQNGTFFNNTIAPQIGYQPSRELTDRNDRRKQGLPERDLMPALERNCTAHCRNTYLSNNSDWVSVDTVISTSPDQIAVAPGSLLREWTAGGRRYFHYKLDHDSVNFYSFISARYEVARELWNGVRIEVYYHPEHKWNVPKMLASIRKMPRCFRKPWPNTRPSW